METSWMGRYRPLIGTIVRNRILFARAVNTKTENIGDGISLTILEWVVLEYVIEHENEDDSMICISERLGLAQSSFSKISRTLCDYGFIAKYQMVGNRKNVIIKPTDEGKKFYLEYAQKLNRTVFEGFFKELDGFSDEDLAHFERAIAHLDLGLMDISPKKDHSRLIRLE